MTTRTPYAFVTLMFGGDSYLPGCLVVAYSVKKYLSQPIDLVCMVTADVSEKAQERLREIYEYVELVDYIEHPVAHLRTQKQEKMYGKWIGKSFTKWRCLGLPYQKVFFLDADQLALMDLSYIFEYPTPCGLFVSPYMDMYMRLKSDYNPRNPGFPDPYEKYP